MEHNVRIGEARAVAGNQVPGAVTDDDEMIATVAADVLERHLHLASDLSVDATGQRRV
jgi:hypothetical protein